MNGRQNDRIQSKTLVVYDNNSKSTEEHVYVQTEHLAKTDKRTCYEPLLKQGDTENAQKCMANANEECKTKDSVHSARSSQNNDNNGLMNDEILDTKIKNLDCHVHFSNTIESSPNKRKSSLMSSSRTQHEYMNGLKNVCTEYLLLSHRSLI